MDFSDLAKIHADHMANYAPVEDELETLRHFSEHLLKMGGKIGDATEPVRHGSRLDTHRVKEEVIGDLVYWALQLGIKFQIDPGDAYLDNVAKAQARIDQERKEQDKPLID